MYKSFHGKRHWTLHVLPLFSVSAETLGENTQIIAVWGAWLFWQHRKEFRFAIV